MTQFEFSFCRPLRPEGRLWQQCCYFSNAPNMVAKSGLHGWRNAPRLVNAAEIVVP